MSVAEDLEKRERQAGNAETGNIGQADYDEKFNKIAKDTTDEDFDDIINNNYGNPDKKNTNYNSDDYVSDTDIAKEKEENPSSLYKPPEEATTSRGNNFRGWLKNKGKKYGASSGLLAGFGGATVVVTMLLSPAALFATIEKSVTNDGSDSARTNVVMRKAYMGGLIGGGECTGSKLKCKMVSATKEQIKKWTGSDSRFKVNGTVLDKDGRPTGESKAVVVNDLKEGERVKINSLEFPNGVVADSNAKFEAETDRSTDSRRSSLRAFNDKASFFLNSKFDKVLGKFGIKKGSISKKDSKKSEKDKAGAKVTAEEEKAKSKVGVTSTKAFAAGGIVSSGVLAACTAYNITRVVVGAVKAKWIADIVVFALPFVQIASKMADGSATDADFTEIEGRAKQLTWYPNQQYTDKLVAAAPDEDKVLIKSKENLTATDSQGLRMAMYGDNTKLTDYTLAYTTGGIGSIALASEAISTIQAAAGGKENIRAACVNATRSGIAASTAQAVACAVGAITIVGGLLCIGKQAAAVAAYMVASYALVKGVTYALTKALESADIPSDLRGVDAGNALAAGIGLMLSRSSRGYGLKPATSVAKIKSFIAATDNDYNKNVTEIAKDDARKDPFNMMNQYSFASTLATSLNPYMSGQKTGFSFAANALGVISNSLIPSASALHSQPSLMTNNNANLDHRLNVNDANPDGKCPDQDKSDIGILCDYSGRMVGVTSDRVLQWAKQMANGDITPLEETIDYMQQKGKYEKIGTYGEADQDGGGTFDDTCNNINSFIDALAGGCDDSRKPSIDESGQKVDGSQYDKYIKFCTEERDLDLGSSDDSVESGTDKDQDWMTGKQCAKDSMMMDRFAFYFNICESQYATANNTTDCVNDTPYESAGNVTTSSCSSNGDTKAIYTCALKYDDYGYVWGGGHGGAAKDITDGVTSGSTAKFTPILDCSGLVRVAFVEAMGIEDQAYVAPGGYDSSKYWTKIPLEQAQQGDIVTSSGHVAIVESNDTAGKNFKIFDAETENAVKEDQIRHSSQSYGGTVAAYRAKAGISI